MAGRATSRQSDSVGRRQLRMSKGQELDNSLAGYRRGPMPGKEARDVPIHRAGRIDSASDEGVQALRGSSADGGLGEAPAGVHESKAGNGEGTRSESDETDDLRDAVSSFYRTPVAEGGSDISLGVQGSGRGFPIQDAPLGIRIVPGELKLPPLITRSRHESILASETTGLRERVARLNMLLASEQEASIRTRDRAHAQINAMQDTIREQRNAIDKFDAALASVLDVGHQLSDRQARAIAHLEGLVGQKDREVVTLMEKIREVHHDHVVQKLRWGTQVETLRKKIQAAQNRVRKRAQADLRAMFGNATKAK